MALRDPHRAAPPGRRPHSWIPSTSTAGALDLVSRHQHAVAGHTLQPLSAYSIGASTALYDLGDALPFMPGCCSEHDRLRPQPYYESIHGSVYYTPGLADHQPRAGPDPSFPAPLIQPRQRRPHSIHIVSYPPGFIPHDLRPSPRQPPTTPTRPSGPPRNVIGTDPREKKNKKEQKAEEKRRKQEEKRLKKVEEKARREKADKRRSIRSLPPGGDRVSRVLGKILAVFSITPKSSVNESISPLPKAKSRPSSFISLARRLSRFEPSVADLVEVSAAPVQPEPLPEVRTSRADGDTEQPVEPGSRIQQADSEGQTGQQPAMTTAALPRLSASGVASSTNRNSMISILSAKHMMSSSVTEVPRPVASTGGVSCSIILAEPNIFLSGFDHDAQRGQDGQTPSALLRGKLRLDVSRSAKLKSVTLKLLGTARTEWPEGIPPHKTELYEEQTLRSQSLVFFHAMQEIAWETEYGNQCTFSQKKVQGHHVNIRNSLYSNSSNHSNTSLHLPGRSRQSNNLTAKELKRLSLQSVKSRSFGKGESPLSNQVQAKGYKVFLPGTYEYAFELPIDHSQLETTKLQYGSVRWDLEAVVERHGAFKANLRGTKEVPVVRLPDQMSLEMSEPISISRQWEDQLHYDIMISGKSFPIGTKIPIAFKLTPLAKVHVHKLKVFVTESIEYWTNDRRVTRKDAGRKILLLEKTAGKPLDKQFNASDIRVVMGGELQPEQREEARMSALTRRRILAERTNRAPDPLPEPTENLLGDLDLGLESFWGSTEIEMNVQIPTCETMARDKTLRLHPDCSWKNVNVYHWIKIVMRISRADGDDPTGKRRRHFEISIDSPFTVLNCRATQANTSLPQYCGRDGPTLEQQQQMSCGCPDAHVTDKSPSSSSANLDSADQDAANQHGLDSVMSSALPNYPRAAYIQSSARSSAVIARIPQSDGSGADSGVPSPMDRDRPIHLLRHPSFNPPAFDAEDPPPPIPADILTPPPNYDMIVGTPSVDGLADYFARLADYEGPGQQRPRQSEELGIRSAEDPDPVSPTSCLPVSGNVAASESGSLGMAGAGGSHGMDFPVDDDSSDTETEDPARPHRRGRVNVANPRTPGGRLLPSRSLEIERPIIQLDMTGVLRRNG